MTVSKECESEILRLVQAEKWPEGTVAAELGVHHDVVTRVLAQDAFSGAFKVIHFRAFS